MRLLLPLICYTACVTIGLAFGDITGTNPAVGSCLCLYYTGVNIRDSPCGAVIGNESPTFCRAYTGAKTTCSLGGVSYEYFELDNYIGGTGWVAGDFLEVGAASSCGGATEPPPPTNCAGVEIVSRADWGARTPAYNIPALPNKPVPRGFVHHTVTGFCSDEAACSAIMRSVQSYHMDTNGWPDIAYNWLVGEDGRAYEGRGWDKEGTHTAGYNNRGVAVCAIGDFTARPPNQAALATIRSLFQCAINEGVLSSTFGLHGHRDAACTACPGDSLYPVIQTWPEYSYDELDYVCYSEDEDECRDV